MSAIKLISLAVKNPGKLRTLLSTLKGTKLYMNYIVAKVLAPALSPLDSKEKAKSIEDFMSENGFRNKELLEEILQILQEDGYLGRNGNLIWLRKAITDDDLEKRKAKVSKIVLDAFETFGDYTHDAFIERLKGKPPEEFDSNELRVFWNVALRGDFYRLQREEAFNFAKLTKFAKSIQEKPFRILDFGCGSGEGTVQLLEALKRENIDFVIDACDISEGLLEIASEDEALETPIYFFSLREKKPKQNYYDAIFISHVLHWIPNPVEMVGELKSYMKPHGMLFGLQSAISKRFYQIDLFIRLLGAEGFPEEKELYRWFEENNMTLKFNSAISTFVAFPKTD